MTGAMDGVTAAEFLADIAGFPARRVVMDRLARIVFAEPRMSRYRIEIKSQRASRYRKNFPHIVESAAVGDCPCNLSNMITYKHDGHHVRSGVSSPLHRNAPCGRR